MILAGLVLKLALIVGGAVALHGMIDGVASAPWPDGIRIRIRNTKGASK